MSQVSRYEVKLETRINSSNKVSFNFILDSVNYWPIAQLFASKTLTTKYRETYFGIVWAFIQPLIHMLVLNLFFGVVIRFSTDGVPYPLHLLTGLVAFQIVTKSVNEGAGAIARSGGILSKIFLPRVIFPVSSLAIIIVETIFPLTILAAFLFYYDVEISLRWLFLFPLAIWLIILASGSLLFFSAICIRFNDARMAIPIFTQLLFFGTPIFYPLKIIPENLLWIFYFNPCVAIVEIFRWILLGYSTFPDLGLVVAGLVSTLFCVAVGVITFGLVDKEFYKYV